MEERLLEVKEREEDRLAGGGHLIHCLALPLLQQLAPRGSADARTYIIQARKSRAATQDVKQASIIQSK